MGINKLKLAVLISGRGSNLQSLIDACQSPDFPAEISVVLSNVPDVMGLERAKKAGIPTITIDHKNFKGQDRSAFEKSMIDALSDHEIDLVCLAGFMRILTPYFIHHFKDRLINIHPSLLPDYKGLNTHQRALDDGKKEAGCTIHVVVPEVDNGPILVQKSVPVMEDDNAESLAARVLAQEHIAYPEAVKMIAEKDVKIIDGQLEFN